MSIQPIAADTTSTSATNSATTTADNYSATFMQLLATELQSQDPTQTMDPTTMVTQIVQINQLSDVAGIYSLLQNTGSGSTTNGGGITPVSGENVPSSRSLGDN
jgi:flagellar hook assembly protein FlgD